MARFVIDWRIEGTWEVEAKDAAEAQEKFDKAWGSPRGIRPERDGEASNDPPQRIDGSIARRSAT